MVKAYRSGLSSKDLFQLSNRDEGYHNAERFQRIWEEELHEAKSDKNGPRPPSLAKCVWKFSRTRLILSSIFIMISIVLQFIAPVSTFSVGLSMSYKYISSKPWCVQKRIQILRYTFDDKMEVILFYFKPILFPVRCSENDFGLFE